MATMIIRDDVLWARHIEGDPDLVRSIRALPAEATIVLSVQGHRIRFHKMRDGRDGRPTEGVRPDAEGAAFWRSLQARRGSMVTVEPVPAPPDPYLLSLTATLSEWNSPEDAGAYDGL